MFAKDRCIRFIPQNKIAGKIVDVSRAPTDKAHTKSVKKLLIKITQEKFTFEEVREN